MAYVDDVVTYKDASDASKNIETVSQSGNHIEKTAVYTADGVPVAAGTPLPVAIITDAAGSAVVTDDESVPRNNAAAALAAAILYGANGVNAATVDRIIAYVYGGALGVSEVGAKGTATVTTVTVDATTTNGVVLIAANTDGTGGLRRRVIITQRGTTAVEVSPTNITAATGKGRLLPGVVGAEQVWFIQGQLRATVASSTQEVSVSTEILA
jgi:hypothetical protein